MENKKPVSQNNAHLSKEEMADIITKNLHASRRESSLKNESDIDYYAKAINNKSKKKKVIPILIIIFILFCTGIFYLYGMNRTQGRFLPNTTLNGIPAGGKTQKEVYDRIMKSDDTDIPDKITLVRFDGELIDIDVDTIGYSDNIKPSVTKYYNEQNHYLWFLSLLNGDDFEFTPEYSFDPDKIDEVVKRKVIDASANLVPKDATIDSNGDDFVVVKEVKGGKIAEDKEKDLLEYVHNCITSGETRIDLSQIDCYEQPKITAEQLAETCQKLNDLSSIKLTFDFTYKKEVLKGKSFKDWIVFDNLKKGEAFDVDKDKAMEYVETLADKYDTYGKSRVFKSTSRGNITVAAGQGCYGWWLDQEKTCNAIIKAIKACKSAAVKPVYYVNPDSNYEYTCNPKWRTAKSDIGNTYMEVDLKKQHFWYYKNGKLAYQCDIVSGMPTQERNTPEGVYKLWIKEKNKTLQGSLASGETWTTPVTFWNNISTIGIGLHDATWHTSFGGTRYKQYGSHGCVNMPYSAAEYVYKNVPMGTPCVMYW